MADDRSNGPRKPESTIVQSFSADLDSMFGLSTGEPGERVDHLEQTVQQKKQIVTTASTELERLEAKLRESEAKLRETEQRLRASSPPRQANTGALHRPPGSAERKPSISGTALASPDKSKTSTDFPLIAIRPQNARVDTRTLMAGMPGALPETPNQEYGGGGSDYVMVDRGSARSERGYGQSVG